MKLLRFSLAFLYLIVELGMQSEVQAQQQNDVEGVVINGKYFGMSLYTIFKNIIEDYDIRMDYDDEILKGKVPQNAAINSLSVRQTMDQLLQDQDIYFIIMNDVVFLRSDPSELPKPEVFLSAQTFDITVTGIIKERGSGETLPNATILVLGTDIWSTSNVDGYFTLYNVPTDTSRLEVRYIGYDTKTMKLNPKIVKTQVEIYIQVANTLLDEVIISDKREKMIKASEGISHVIISPMEIAALPSLGEKDIFRSMQLLPGVSATNETSSGLYVRGGTPDQNLILYDGFTVYQVDHFYGFFSAFNSNAIKDIQFYKGGFDSKYGGRLSSVVDITGKSGNTEKFSMSGGISAISANITVESPFAKGKGSVLVAGRRSYTDIIQTGLYDDISNLFENESATDVQGQFRRFAQVQTEPSFYFYDLNAKVSYRPTPDDIISFSFYNGQDNLDNSRVSDGSSSGFGGRGGNSFSFNNNTTDLTQWGNWGTSLRYGKQWNPDFYSNIILAYSNFYSDRDRYSTTDVQRDTVTFQRNTGTVDRNDLKDITFRWDNEWTPHSSHKLGFGGQITFNDVDYSLVLDDSLSIIDRKDIGTTSALYFQDEIKITQPFSLKLGARLNYYDVTEQFYFEPRASFSYKLSDRFNLKGAYGIYHQYVNRIIREGISEGAKEFWLLADGESNSVSKAIHYIAGLSYETDKWLFDTELFYKDMTNLTEYSLRFQQARGGSIVSQEEYFYTGNGVSKGVELLVQKKFGQFSGWLGYTYSQVLYDFSELSENLYPALHDQTHELKLVGIYNWGRWDFGAVWIYATGKPYTAPIGGYTIDLLDGGSNSYFHVGDKNGERLPAYHRLDLSATYNFNLGKGTSQFGLSIFNFYNHQNIWYKEFDVVEDELIVTDVNTLGITPNLFFNFKF